MQKKEELWIQVLKLLKKNKSISRYLTLKCQTHGTVNYIQRKGDFKSFRHGGCSKNCEIRMECGHVCKKKCHPIRKTLDDPTGHKDVKCEKM